MEQMRFAMVRPAEAEGDLAWAWHHLERDLNWGFWMQPLISSSHSREGVYLEHWLTETGHTSAFERASVGKPLFPEEHLFLLEALREDAVAYQRLVRDGRLVSDDGSIRARMPVAETSPLVPVVIHLIRGWYPIDEVQESFRVLAAWEAEATKDHALDVLECLPHPELPLHAVLDRIRMGEGPPIKSMRSGSREPTHVEDALWRTLEELASIA